MLDKERFDPGSTTKETFRAAKEYIIFGCQTDVSHDQNVSIEISSTAASVGSLLLYCGTLVALSVISDSHIKFNKIKNSTKLKCRTCSTLHLPTTQFRFNKIPFKSFSFLPFFYNMSPFEAETISS